MRLLKYKHYKQSLVFYKKAVLKIFSIFTGKQLCSSLKLQAWDLQLHTPIEGIYVKLNFRKKNWLLCCTYNPNRNIITNHLDALKRSLDPYSTKYDDLMVIGDLNAEINLECMKLFGETYDLSSLVKVPTCYENPEKPSCIGLLFTNWPKSFQN